MDKIEYLKPYRINETTLERMLEAVDSNTVTFNIVDNGGCAMSNTIMFCHIKEDEFQDGLMTCESGNTLRCFIAKSHLKNYLLTDVKQTFNGYDHHFIFTYQFGG